MKREAEYKTRQRSLMLERIKSKGSEHFTVDGMVSELEKDGAPVGKSTVYRFLEKMAADGLVIKHSVEGERTVCYQYVGDSDECRNHYHLKCEKCGRLIHMECDTLDKIAEHILKEHKFRLNGAKSTFYGVCEACTADGGDEDE